jgi:hypothetical protein
MHPHPHIDVNPEAALRLLAHPGHLAGDVQRRQHRPAHIVLVRNGVTEHRQQPITLGRADMPLKAIHDRQHQLAVAPNEQVIGLRFYLGGQHGRIDQISE